MHENASYAAKHFWKTLVVVVVVFVKVAFLMLFFYDDDALKKGSEKNRKRLVPLPWSSLRVSFFFASKKETERRARAPDRGYLTHPCASVTWHVFLSATF